MPASEEPLSLSDFHDLVNDHWRTSTQRYGQALFNTLKEVRPDLAEAIRGTARDPFHSRSVSDPRLEHALLHIEKYWGGLPSEVEVSPSSSPELLAQLGFTDDDLQAAADALRKLSPEQRDRALALACAEEDGSVLRENAARFLAECKDPLAAALIRSLLDMLEVYATRAETLTAAANKPDPEGEAMRRAEVYPVVPNAAGWWWCKVMVMAWDAGDGAKIASWIPTRVFLDPYSSSGEFTMQGGAPMFDKAVWGGPCIGQNDPGTTR